jgi:competence protein ComEA
MPAWCRSSTERRRWLRAGLCLPAWHGLANSLALGLSWSLSGGPAQAQAPVPAPPATLELNQASRAQLESLQGLGPQLVERLLAERARHGPYRDWAQLRRRLKGQGLGPRLLQRLSDQGLRIQGQPWSVSGLTQTG